MCDPPNVIPNIDNLLIGGGMSFTFLKYNNITIGKSIFDSEGYKQIENIYKLADKYNTKIFLPIDFKVSNEFSNDGKINEVNEIDKDSMGLDIGFATIKIFKNVI